MADKYQLIIIGSGPGGYTAAIRAAQYGLKTAIVENRDFGGTCLNRGCIPTKALLHTAEAYHTAGHKFEAMGLSVTGLDFDALKVFAHKDEIVGQLRDGVGQLLKANKVDAYHGIGTITAPGKVTVKGEETVELETENILIASGSVPTMLPIPGKDLPGVVTSDEILEGNDILKGGKLPQRLCIIGGGVIGCEFAGVFNSLGCEVTIVEFLDRITATVDKDISQNLSMIMKKRGITINVSSKVTRVEQQGDDYVCFWEAKDGSEQSVAADLILVSTGRRANTAGLLADGFELEMNRGMIVVDDKFQTSVPGVYAIGDVIGGIQLAHKAEAEGQAAVAIIAGKPHDVHLELVPSCIYTDPEIAQVGMTEAQAAEQGIEVKVGKFMMAGNGKTIIEMADRGFIKVIFDAKTDVVLGCVMMCCRATDMLSELTTAIANKLTLEQLASVIRPHPTFNEGVTEAIEAAEGMSIHTAPKRTR